MKRVVTGLILIPFFIYIVLWSPSLLFLAAVTAVAMLSFREYARLMSHYNVRAPGVFGYAAGLLVLFLPRLDFVFVVFIALLALGLAMTTRDLSHTLPYAGSLLLGIVYTFGCMRMTISLRQLGHGAFWLLFALSVNWVGDIAAFYVGRSWGKHKLAPRVSPAKSWEGAAASTIMSLIYAAVYFSFLIKDVPLPWALGIAAVGNMAGQIGDLCESAIKRGAGVKDSGTMLPGHGGWLDRIDSSLFALPVIYYLASLQSQILGH